MAMTQYRGTGRRKSSIARVRLLPGTGKVIINKKELNDYFPAELLRREVLRPLSVVGAEGKYDIIALVSGGGLTGQAGALRHGVSRALVATETEGYKKALKLAGFLTRDPRMKERKKYEGFDGLVSAHTDAERYGDKRCQKKSGQHTPDGHPDILGKAVFGKEQPSFAQHGCRAGEKGRGDETKIGDEPPESDENDKK